MSIQLSTCSPKEFIHLLKLLEENRMTCFLEINLGIKNDPFVFVPSTLVFVDFDEDDGGICLTVGGTDIYLDAGYHFGKRVSKAQIFLSATGIDDGPTIWIYSSGISPTEEG